MATLWPLLVTLLVHASFNGSHAKRESREFDLLEAGSLSDPFVYAASNSVDWSSRITPTTTPESTVSRPNKNRASTSNYQGTTSPSYPETRRAPKRKKKVTTTSAPSTYNKPTFDTPFNTEPYPRSTGYSGSQSTYRGSNGNSGVTYTPSQAPSPYSSSPYSSPPQDRASLYPRRKPVYEQPAPPIPKPTRSRPTEFRQSQPSRNIQQESPRESYSTAFPTPQPPNKRIVVIRKKQQRKQPQGQQQQQQQQQFQPQQFQQPQQVGFSTPFNYGPSTGPQPVNFFTPVPANIPHYDEEIHRFTDIRDQILQSADAEPAGSRQQPNNYFDPPKFEIPKGLNDKGCKMVIKEVAELPKDLHARGSDLLESFFRSKRSPTDKRKVKSIIMTKECYYPDGTPSSSVQSSHIDPKFFSFSGPSRSSPRESTNQSPRRVSRPQTTSSTQRFDQSPYYDYPNEGRQQESSYEPRERDSSEPPQQRQAPSRPSQSKKEPKRVPPSGGFQYSSSVGPSTKQQRGPGYGSSQQYSNDEGPYGGDYREGSPSMSKFESDGFGDDYGGFGFEGFGEEHPPSKSKPRASPSGGSQSSASNRGKATRHGPRPTPKMYQKTFQFYKKDDGKDDGPNNNSNAEEYASGYFKHYSTDYDSDRDGPQKKKQ